MVTPARVGSVPWEVGYSGIFEGLGFGERTPTISETVGKENGKLGYRVWSNPKQKTLNPDLIVGKTLLAASEANARTSASDFGGFYAQRTCAQDFL